MEPSLCPGCREHLARIAVLEAEVLELKGIVRDLLDRLKPPTPPRAQEQQPPAPAKTPTGRKRGGQPGHPPHFKKLVPPQRVKTFVPFLPTQCGKCQTALPKDAGPNDPAPSRHQVAELPKVAAEITEYQGHYRTCPCCGEVTHAPIPADIRAHCVGPHLTAALAYFVGSHGVSKRGVEEIADHLFDAPIALGTVANLEAEVSLALTPAHQEAQAAIAAAPIKHVDETGWKQNGKKRWLGTAATATVVAFLIHPRRNLSALKKLVGETLLGILCSDRWCIYDDWPIARRQLCWAHVKRNWQKQIDRGGPGSKAAELGEAFLDLQKRVFEAWHLFRGGGTGETRATLDERIVPFMLEAAHLLERGERSRDPKLARFCARLRKLQAGLWTFVSVEGVEPTNNHAERVQRRAVLWRRRSFGCHSADGCRFVERILTVVQTLRLQDRPVLTFLSDAVRAHRAGLPSPKLVVAG